MKVLVFHNVFISIHKSHILHNNLGLEKTVEKQPMINALIKKEYISMNLSMEDEVERWSVSPCP